MALVIFSTSRWIGMHQLGDTRICNGGLKSDLVEGVGR